jgi:hypothetical protein
MNCDHPFGTQGRKGGLSEDSSGRYAHLIDRYSVSERAISLERGLRGHFVKTNWPEGQVYQGVVQPPSGGPAGDYWPWFKTRAISPSAWLSSARRKLRSAMIQSAPA